MGEVNYRRLSCLGSHKHSPPKSSSDRALIQSFQIPNKLRACSFERRLVNSGHRPHKEATHPQVNPNINKHVGPKRSNRIQTRSTQRHLKLSHVSNTTVCKQLFQKDLCQGCQSSKIMDRILKKAKVSPKHLSHKLCQ